MVEASGEFKPRYKEQILEFCSINNLIVTNLHFIGNRYYYRVSGDIDDVDNLIKCINKIKKDRKQNNFFRKLYKRITQKNL